MSFADIAYKVLKEHKKPLSYKEIIYFAKRKGLQSFGATPELTMHSVMSAEINKYAKKARFVKIDNGKFTVNPSYRMEQLKENLKTNKISTKQRGNLAEAWIVELITLFSKKPLVCYQPVSDDEGVDIIVKEKGVEKPREVYIQVKSSQRVDSNVFVAKVKEQPSLCNPFLAIIFCRFDVKEGNWNPTLWFVPARILIKKVKPKKYKKDNLYIFVSGLTHRAKMWDKFLVDKFDIADKIHEFMETAYRSQK